MGKIEQFIIQKFNQMVLIPFLIKIINKPILVHKIYGTLFSSRYAQSLRKFIAPRNDKTKNIEKKIN